MAWFDKWLLRILTPRTDSVPIVHPSAITVEEDGTVMIGNGYFRTLTARSAGFAGAGAIMAIQAEQYHRMYAPVAIPPPAVLDPLPVVESEQADSSSDEDGDEDRTPPDKLLTPATSVESLELPYGDWCGYCGEEELWLGALDISELVKSINQLPYLDRDRHIQRMLVMRSMIDAHPHRYSREDYERVFHGVAAPDIGSLTEMSSIGPGVTTVDPDSVSSDKSSDDSVSTIPSESEVLAVETAPVRLGVLRRVRSLDRISQTSVETTFSVKQKLWEKMYRSTLKTAPRNSLSLTGSAFWDWLFPRSCGKRYTTIPARKILYWPVLDYPKQDCLLVALSEATGEDKHDLWMTLAYTFPEGAYGSYHNGLNDQVLDVLAIAKNINVKVAVTGAGPPKGYGVQEGPPIILKLSAGHWSYPKRQQKRMIVYKSPSGHADRKFGFVMSKTAKALLTEVSSLPMISWSEWTPEFPRAEAYVRNLYDNTTGTLGRDASNRLKLKGWEDEASLSSKSPTPRYVASIEGDPGCRKSSALQKILRQTKYQEKDSFQVSLPTTVLRQDWAKKLGAQERRKDTGKGLPNYYIETFEKALADGNTGSIFITDEYKFPPGYQALKALLYPRTTHFLKLGDRFQTLWHDPNPECTLGDGRFQDDGVFYAAFTTTYLVGTWRFPAAVANFFRMPTFTNVPGGIHFSNTQIKEWGELRLFFPGHSDDWYIKNFNSMLTLVPADADVRVGDVMNQNNNVTFTSSQGLGSDIVQVVLTQTALTVTDVRTLYTSMTRGPNLIVVFHYQREGRNRAMEDIHPIIKHLARLAESYHLGQPVTIVPEHTVNVKELIGPLPSSVKQTLAGPPDKCFNRAFVEQFHPLTLWQSYIDPDDPTNKGGYRMLGQDDPVYEDQPNFRKFITGVQEILPTEPKPPEETIARARKIPTHLPVVEKDALVEKVLSTVRERTERELDWKGLLSEQMPDGWLLRSDADKVLAKAVARDNFSSRRERQAAISRLREQYQKRIPADNPLLYDARFANLGALQSAKDSVSFAAGVGQRIRKETRLENHEDYTNKEMLGVAFFESFKFAMGWQQPFAWDEVLFQRSVAEFQERRANRSQALKQASLNRADPLYMDFLTAKTQWKLKDDIPPNAKPLQTLFVRSDEYLFRFGPIGIYLLHVFKANLPPHIYVHVQTTIEEMSAWFAKYDPCTDDYFATDIKGYDGTQRGASLQFEARIMEFMGVPQDVIDSYVEDKLDMHTRSFTIGLMRLSGEVFTYLFNTFHKIARDYTKYAIPYGAPYAFSGDDGLGFEEYPERSSWAEFRHLDVCEETIDRGEYGEFCSYTVKRKTVFKKPQRLFMRLVGAVARGRVEQILDGYFLDFLTFYRLGDVVMDVMDPEQAEYAQAVARIMFNLRREYKSNVSVNWGMIDAVETDAYLALLPDLIGIYAGDSPVANVMIEGVGNSYTEQEAIISTFDDGSSY